MEELCIKSSLDGSMEPSFFMRADFPNPAPLVVCLHTWSTDRWNQVDPVSPLANKLGWHVLFPEFRGPNSSSNPRAVQACASPLARQDIIDAVDHVSQSAGIDRSKIFLLGGSGGGHMALMMAAFHPERWAMVYASCSITDLTAWHGENKGYAPQIEACCGGPPDTPERKAEYLRRSPISYAEQIGQAHVYLSHGKHDGSVPYTHSLNLYRRIAEFVPQARVYLEIFDGGHEVNLDQALALFSRNLNASGTATKLSG